MTIAWCVPSGTSFAGGLLWVSAKTGPSVSPSINQRLSVHLKGFWLQALIAFAIRLQTQDRRGQRVWAANPMQNQREYELDLSKDG
jgi:hypothetical protein